MPRVFGLLKDHWQLIGLSAVLFAFWDTDFVWPLRVLIVLFHEMAHAIVALLTGGEVVELTINRREGGHVLFIGGNYIWTAMAGYLGSLAIGVFLFLMAVTTNLDRGLTLVLGALILLINVIYVRELFAVVFMLITGIVFVGVGWKLPIQFSDFLLRVVGLTSMLYVPWDIASDTIFTVDRMSLAASDAQAIAYQLGLTEKIVGVVWVLISVVVIFFTLRFTLKRPSNLSVRARQDSR